MLGVAHDIQQVEFIPEEPWDLPLGKIVTNKEIITTGQ